MTVRPNAAILRFQSVVEQAKSAVMDKDDRDFANDLGAVLHWLDFAEQALQRRDALMIEVAEQLRKYEAHHLERAAAPASFEDECKSRQKAAVNSALASRIEKLLGLVVETGGCGPDVVVVQ